MGDADYHFRRAAEEYAIAASTRSGVAREIHIQLAAQHADRAWTIKEAEAARPAED